MIKLHTKANDDGSLNVKKYILKFSTPKELALTIMFLIEQFVELMNGVGEKMTTIDFLENLLKVEKEERKEDSK